MKKSDFNLNKVMGTTQFGFPLFIAPLKNGLGSIQITDKIEEAERWDSEFSQTQLKYHSAVTGYTLEFMIATMPYETPCYYFDHENKKIEQPNLDRVYFAGGFQDENDKGKGLRMIYCGQSTGVYDLAGKRIVCLEYAGKEFRNGKLING